jgi:hypothetical protein
MLWFVALLGIVLATPAAFGVALLYLGDAARADRFLTGMVVGSGLTAFLLAGAMVTG